MPEIERSSRHTRIVGDCGEAFLAHWLSRSGFEVALIDHTGIDLLAFHPGTQRRLGITVKSRTRTHGTGQRAIKLFEEGDREKVRRACDSFGCEPWIGIDVEREEELLLYLTSVDHHDSRYRLGRRATQEYEADAGVLSLRLTIEARWDWKSAFELP